MVNLAALDDAGWWRSRAACASAPLPLVDEVFRAPGSPAGKQFVQDFCARCPVWRLCLQEAMETGEAGIWGGTTSHIRTLHGGANYRMARPDPDRLRRL